MVEHDHLGQRQNQAQKEAEELDDRVLRDLKYQMDREEGEVDG